MDGRAKDILDRYPLVVFEGPPTSGKTMLAKRFAENLSRRAILEPTGVMLSWFHEDRANRALLTQIYFLGRRMTQAKEVNALISRGEKVCQDFALWKDVAYAQTFLSHKEYKVYYTLYQLLEPLAPSPDILIVLDCSPDVIMARLKRRNRKGESSLGIREIKEISKFTMLLANKQNCRKIYINTTDSNIASDRNARDKLFNVVIERIMEL